MDQNFLNALQSTLSRLLPLIIAVGKYFATSLTAERICKKCKDYFQFLFLLNVNQRKIKTTNELI